MPFNLVSLLSSKKTDVPADVRESVARAVSSHAPLELFDVPACSVRLRSGVFFNNLSQNRIVFELDRYSCPRGLRKGQTAVCSFALHLVEDLWDYHKFESRILVVSLNHGRTSLQLAMPLVFTQRHTRNGQRLPLLSEESCTLQIWQLRNRLPSHLAELMERTPLIHNGGRGNAHLLDISKGGMGLLLPHHGISPAPTLEQGDELVLRLAMPFSLRTEPLHCVLSARVVRVVDRSEGRKAGLQFKRLAILDQAKAMRWQELDERGVVPLARLVRESCERLKAGPLR